MCLLNEIMCPNCGNVNSYLLSVEEEGRHFCCPDCDAHWYDLKYYMSDSSDHDNIA